MKIKEKCIYYNPVQKGYYLAYSIDDEMVYGRRGEYVKTSNLERWINQNGPGLRFKIGDIIIDSDYIRNYFLNEKDLESFELVKELTDEEFSIIETLTYSDYCFPSTLADINKLVEQGDANVICQAIKDKEEKISKLESEIFILNQGLYNTIYE